MGGAEDINFYINPTIYNLDKVDNIVENESYVDRLCVVVNEITF